MSKDIRRAIMITKGMTPSGDAHTIVPESPETLAIQSQMLAQGRRAVTMYPRATPNIPAPPPGMKSLKTADGVFHYNPKMISPEAIHDAVRRGRINEIIGLGPYSKQDIYQRVAQGEQSLAVVGRDAEGREALSAIGTPSTAMEQIHHIRQATPPGGSVGVESIHQPIYERAMSILSRSKRH